MNSSEFVVRDFQWEKETVLCKYKWPLTVCPRTIVTPKQKKKKKWKREKKVCIFLSLTFVRSKFYLEKQCNISFSNRIIRFRFLHLPATALFIVKFSKSIFQKWLLLWNISRFNVCSAFESDNNNNNKVT